LMLIESPASAADDAPSPDAATPPLVLKLAPELVPPEVRTAPRPGPRGGVAPSTPQAPLRVAPFLGDGGSVVVRADSVTGVPEKFIEAEGKVELRTRSETVLADWLRYDFVDDEVWGKGNVLLRRGFDWITGPEARFKRDTESGYFKSPKFFIAEN